ncbi:MAG: hypothetical protein EXR61_03860 [Chloroflexi bacterium]|nr:hypothetical protein [Chloroflexota bacterium]
MAAGAAGTSTLTEATLTAATPPEDFAADADPLSEVRATDGVLEVWVGVMLALVAPFDGSLTAAELVERVSVLEALDATLPSTAAITAGTARMRTAPLPMSQWITALQARRYGRSSKSVAGGRVRRS